ncbi:MAG: ABC transporter substrate-binding protein [Deltaproteobacteria bacterium]|nr:ABC transporter substrate-binding protein [Deltaproteobacteria bacterium]
MKNYLKIIVSFAVVMSFTSVCFAAGTVNIGVLQGFTGPIESLTPPMAASAELAIKEASDSGVFLGGTKIKAIRGDSTCVDAAAATAAAERLISSEKVVAIVGPSCSGATTAVVNNVSAPNGITTISSSATSPALSMIKDNGYFFRTAPSDARQGQVLAKITINKGIKKVALTYTNNDYGKGLSESFGKAYKKLGGKILMTAAHEDGKADYSADVAALSASGAKDLVVFGYLDQGGKGIVQASLDSGAFSRFIFADGMIGSALTKDLGKDLNGSFGTMPGGESVATKKWKKIATSAGIATDGPFRGGSYDAAALIILAAQAGNSADKTSIQKHVMSVANAPGVKIFAGELKKGLEILAKGGEIDYVGATDIEFSKIGEVFGTYQEMEIINGKFVSVKVH